MPVTADDFLQEATGHTTSSTSVVVTLPSGTAGDTTVIVFINVPSTTIAAAGYPPGWWRAPALANIPVLYRAADPGETTWTFTLTAAASTAWHVMEIDNLALSDPVDVSAGVALSTTLNGATRSTGTTALNAGSSTLAFAAFGTTKTGAGDVQSWGSYTNGFVERVDSAPAGVGTQLAVAYKLVEGWSTYECTATFATSVVPSNNAGSLVVLFRARDASINAPLSFLTGFEFGTHGGMGALAGSLSPTGGICVGTWGTGYLVQAGSALSGSYGAQIVASASAPTILTAGQSSNVQAVGVRMRMISATGTPTVAWFDASGTDLFVLYDATTTQFGLQWSGGTAVWQTGTTPLSTSVWIEVRIKTNGPDHHADWWIETGTGDGHQTAPTDLSGMALGLSSLAFKLGTPVNATFTADYDDLVVTKHFAAFPLGPHTVRLLVPETTGASVSGTAANFNQFTANGTLAAFASTNGALLDEVPPTVSASADGVVQVASAASEYMSFPMTTYTCTSTEVIAGVRMAAPMWAGAGTGAGAVSIRGYDGTSETSLTSMSSTDPGSPTAMASGAPIWQQAMWSGGVSGAWTQARLDAAALRVGFSGDVIPPTGASALYLEVATRPTPAPFVAHRLTSDEDPEAVAATVIETLHPYQSGVRTYTVANGDATRTAVFNYSIGGTPQTPVTVAPTDPPVDVPVNVEAFGEVDSTSFGWQ